MKQYIEQLDPLFCSDLLKPKDILYRFDNTASRYYLKFTKDGTETSYMGATAATDRLVGGKRAGLDHWYAKNGETAFLMLKVLAEYGTQMHKEIAAFERNGRVVNFEFLTEATYKTAIESGFPFAAEEWAYHMPRNIASWIQFVVEKEVKVLAVEYPVSSDKFKIATLVDVYCEMKFGKKRVRAIINLKKGYTDGREDEDKTFYEPQDCQLQIEKMLWNEMMPKDQQAEMVFNWSPNNWRDEPTFTLKNWTDKTSWPLERLLDCLPMLKWEFNPPQKQVILYGEYTPEKNLVDCMKKVRVSRDGFEVVAEDETTKQLKESVEKVNAAQAAK